jgi:hypothetical protein
MRARRRTLLGLLVASTVLSTTAAGGTGYLFYRDWKSVEEKPDELETGLRGLDYVVDERLTTVENNYTKLASEIDHGVFARTADLATTNRKLAEAAEQAEEAQTVADKAYRRVLDVCIINRIC